MSLSAKPPAAAIPWIDAARMLAIFGVVLLHCAVPVIADQSSVGQPGWWAGTVYDALGCWCVPVFVMLSGALLLDPAKTEPLALFYRKRLNKVLIPLIFWSLFYLGWTYLRDAHFGQPPAPLSLVKNLLAGRPYYHMWFMFMIVGVYALTPFIRMAARAMPSRQLAWLVAALLLVVMADRAVAIIRDAAGRDLPLNWPLEYVPYFVAGQLLRQWRGRPHMALLLTAAAGLIAATAMGVHAFDARFGMERSYFFDPFSLTVVPLSFCLFLALQRIERSLFSPRLTQIGGQLVLGIYLLHPLVLDLFGFAGLRLLAYSPLYAIPLLAVAVFIIAAVAVAGLRQVPYLRRVVG